MRTALFAACLMVIGGIHAGDNPRKEDHPHQSSEIYRMMKGCVKRSAYDTAEFAGLSNFNPFITTAAMVYGCHNGMVQEIQKSQNNNKK